MSDNEWIKWEWTEEKPYPETLDTVIEVMFTDGATDKDTVAFWHDDGYEDNFNCEEAGYLNPITHYRITNTQP